MATSNAWYWWVLALVIIVAVVVLGQRGSDRDARLRQEGMAASGRVLAARQTGEWVNNNPRVELHLAVAGTSSTNYEVRLLTVIPQIHLPAVQPGKVLRLKVEPDDLDHVVIDEDWAH
ncbi:MAG: hypothetical protein KDG52_08370 [Rhodocyclaceae bacterium]|nr:hypothetical protein [Rhodocyclaceae bacterium]